MFLDNNGRFFWDAAHEFPASFGRGDELRQILGWRIQHVEEENSDERSDFSVLDMQLPLGEGAYFEYEPSPKMRAVMAALEAKGEEVKAGPVEFQHLYGHSYFGSGGASGSVRAYVLADWREGVRTPKALTSTHDDNGFVAGPKACTIEPDTIVVCNGGDCIGNGRTWQEVFLCEATD